MQKEEESLTLEQKQKFQEPTNFEDILFNQLKNAKFAHPIASQSKIKTNVNDDEAGDNGEGWA